MDREIKCQRNRVSKKLLETREIVFVRLESNVLLDKEKKVTKKTWPPNVHVFFYIFTIIKLLFKKLAIQKTVKISSYTV